MNLILPLAAALALSGCAISKPVSPADVAALESAVEVSERLAINYTRLPACGSTGATNLCADPATKARVKAYGQKAYDAVMALKSASASGAPAALAAVEVALGQLQASIPAAPAK